MQTIVPHTIAKAFLSSAADQPNRLKSTLIGDGLINYSYRVQYGDEPALFIQRINTEIFVQPESLEENYLRLFSYLQESHPGIRMPRPVCTSEGKYLVADDSGQSWRAFEFIEDSRVFEQVHSPALAGYTAQTFARFTDSFSGFDIGLLIETIPQFHDLELRYRQFESAVQSGKDERLETAASLIDALRERKKYADFYKKIKSGEEFRKRVMHHDAKIGNILFHTKSGNVICPVDYDTVMPGYFFSDLGDMIRSMAGDRAEDDVHHGNVNIRGAYYRAILDEYTSVLGDHLTAAEHKYIHAAGLLMIDMQTLRFLADYLTGDRYYQTRYPDHNLDRALNQFRLLTALEDFLCDEFEFTL